jgi:hypothetical protein
MFGKLAKRLSAQLWTGASRRRRANGYLRACYTFPITQSRQPWPPMRSDLASLAVRGYRTVSETGNLITSVTERDKLIRDTQRHRDAVRSYPDEDARLVEVAHSGRKLSARQDGHEQRRLAIELDLSSALCWRARLLPSRRLWAVLTWEVDIVDRLVRTFLIRSVAVATRPRKQKGRCAKSSAVVPHASIAIPATSSSKFSTQSPGTPMMERAGWWSPGK